MNGDKRTWAIVLALVSALVSFSSFWIIREFDAVNARIDRITEFVLDKLGNYDGNKRER